jgi:thiol:disulfide interchange protein
MASSKTVQKVHIDKLQSTLVKLEKLEEKPKEELSVRESIYFLRDKLRSALKKGYSYQDLSEILEEQEILISAATLKQYLTESSKEATKRRRSTKLGQAKQGQKKEAETTEIEETERKNAENESKQKGEREKSELEESQEINQPGNDVESLKKSEVKLSEEERETEVGESQRENRKTGNAKLKRLASSNTDLSSEFNQY